jgi:hypothetical protein
MPCVWKRELSGVDTRPSAPPSKTWIWPICQTARSPLRTEPGITLFAVVFSEHSAPALMFALAEQGIVTGNEVCVTVPGVVEVGSLNRSVRRRL